MKIKVQKLYWYCKETGVYLPVLWGLISEQLGHEASAQITIAARYRAVAGEKWQDWTPSMPDDPFDDPVEDSIAFRCAVSDLWVQQDDGSLKQIKESPIIKEPKQLVYEVIDRGNTIALASLAFDPATARHLYPYTDERRGDGVIVTLVSHQDILSMVTDNML